LSSMSTVCKTAILTRMREREPLWGSWNIAAFIGAGAHGCVFRLEKETQGHTFVSALKVIPLTRELDRQHRSIESLQASVNKDAEEILLLYRLGNHQNVVTWYDHEIFYYRDASSITADIAVRIEFLQKPLSKLLTQGSMSWEQTVKILIDCLRGLEHVHSKSIIHRDIKPDNIFIAQDGMAKIGDFGVARLVSETTHAETRVGTPLYISPEIMTDPLGQGYDQRVDVYSLGLLAYEMLEGALPFEKACQGNRSCMVRRRLAGETITFHKELPPGLVQAVLGALAHNPDWRYASAREFRDALAKVLASHGAETISPAAGDASPSLAGESDRPAAQAKPSTPAQTGQPPRGAQKQEPPSKRPEHDQDIPAAVRRNYQSGARERAYGAHPDDEKPLLQFFKDVQSRKSKSQLSQERTVIAIFAAIGAGAQFFLQTATPIAPIGFLAIYIALPMAFLFRYRTHVMYLPICFSLSWLTEHFLAVGSVRGALGGPTTAMILVYFICLLLVHAVATFVRER